MLSIPFPTQVHNHLTKHALIPEERHLRNSALYIIDNLNLVTLALRLCDFKEVTVAVEAKHVRLLPDMLPADLIASLCIERRSLSFSDPCRCPTIALHLV